MYKDFDSWKILKRKLNDKSGAATFNEREIWWCSVGVNIGHEEDGKSELFSRPVLVLKKFNNHIFLGIPLTSVRKYNPYYFVINFKQQESCLLLSQLRVFESKRLTTLQGKISSDQFEKIRNVISKMILGSYPIRET